jgi:hypothetical protein
MQMSSPWPLMATGGWRLVWQFLRPVAARVLSLAWCGNADIFAGGAWPVFVPSGEHFSLASAPDHRHLQRNLRGRCIKGRAAPIACTSVGCGSE